MFLNYFVLFAISLNLSAKTFINCTEASPSSFNPQLVNDGPTFNASGITLYDRLLKYELGTTKIIPALAESYKILDGGKAYLFNLRKGVKFHSSKNFTPTRDFSAEDVIFSIDRQRVKSHPYHLVGGGIYPNYEGNIKDNIKEVIAINPYQIKIILNDVQASFLSTLASPFMSILSAQYAEKLLKENTKEKIDLEPIGTGPFIFQSYVKDNSIKYIRNDFYWNQSLKKDNLNSIDKLIFAITPDSSVRFQKLKTDECNFITLPAIADLKSIQENTNMQLMSQEGLNIGYLAMNVTKKPFNNLLVRKAIAYALNKKNYISAIYQNTAVNAVNPIPPALWSYDNTIKDYEYNLSMAKKLIKEAGYENGFETEMVTLPIARPYNPDGKKMGELMQADLAQIGIKLKLKTYDWGSYLKIARTGEHQMIQFGWTGNSDPDTFLNDLLSCASVETGNNMARWCHPKFNELVVNARKMTDQNKRTKLYQEAQKIFKAEIPWVTLAHAKVFRAMNKKVKGYKIDPFGYDYFDQVTLE
jgi:dipeptide transport system substrate-binding protein